MLEQTGGLKYRSTWETNENKKLLFSLHRIIFLTFWKFKS